jgi:hypothetical protein
MLERCRQEQGKQADDNSVIGGPAQLTSQAKISEPKFGFGLAIILGESRRGAKPDQKLGPTNGLAEDSRARWLGGWTTILRAIVTPAPVLMVASRCTVTASTLAVFVDVVTGVSGLTVVDDALTDRGCLVPLRCGLGMNRDLFLLPRGLHRLLRGKPAMP